MILYLIETAFFLLSLGLLILSLILAMCVLTNRGKYHLSQFQLPSSHNHCLFCKDSLQNRFQWDFTVQSLGIPEKTDVTSPG